MQGSDTGTYLGKIHLIDLAGSENVGKSGVTGQGMKEAPVHALHIALR